MGYAFFHLIALMHGKRKHNRHGKKRECGPLEVSFKWIKSVVIVHVLAMFFDIFDLDIDDVSCRDLILWMHIFTSTCIGSTLAPICYSIKYMALVRYSVNPHPGPFHAVAGGMFNIILL